MKSKRKTDQELVEDIINTMFLIAGHDVGYADVKDRKDQWYLEWTMTPEQQAQWKEYCVNYFKKHRLWSKSKCIREADMANLMWGLKIINPKQEECHEG